MTESHTSLAGKRVAVIGGASGIGFAIAEVAASRGAHVTIGSSSAEKVAAAAARLGGGATGHRIDLRDEASVAAFFTALGAFDHLAITAGDWGIPMFAPTRDLDLAAAREVFAVRFWGSLAAAKYASRTIAADGSIALTSGMMAHRPRKGAPVATAAGGAVEFLTRGLAVDLAPVRVNAVCPGLVATEHVTTNYPAAAVAAMVSPQPIPRAATPHECAQAYVYLMLNGYATGQILPVDGGGHLI